MTYDIALIKIRIMNDGDGEDDYDDHKDYNNHNEGGEDE